MSWEGIRPEFPYFARLYSETWTASPLPSQDPCIRRAAPVDPEVISKWSCHVC